MTLRTSVLIPTYDQPGLLLEALESVFAQTRPPIEIVVVDDGSPPSTADALRPLGERIRYLRKDRGGPASAKNAGLRVCRGEVVAFLDHDDVWFPEKLQVQIDAMRRTGEPVSYSRYETTGTAHRPPGVRPAEGYSGRILHRLLERTMIRTSSCVIVDREAILDAGPFREDLAVADDYEMWLRLARRHPFRFVDRCLVRYRQHPAAASVDMEAKDRDMVRILREWRDDPALSARGRRALRRRLARHLGRQARRSMRAGRAREAIPDALESIRLRLLR